MAQLVVRNMESDVKLRLQRRAKSHGRSMEEEVRHILRHATATEDRSVKRLGSRIAERFKNVGLSFALPEFHGERVRAADFDE